MALTEKPEQFNFKISKNSATARWLANQRNKTRSVEFLIEWAIQNIGPGDLIDASVKQALTSGNITPASQPTIKSIDDSNGSIPKTIEPIPIPSKKEPTIKKETTSHNTVHSVASNIQPAILQNMLD